MLSHDINSRSCEDESVGDDNALTVNKKQTLIGKGSRQTSNIAQLKDDKKLAVTQLEKMQEACKQKEDRIIVTILEDRNVNSKLEGAQLKIENNKRDKRLTKEEIEASQKTIDIKGNRGILQKEETMRKG